jgi:hypothetical protein
VMLRPQREVSSESRVDLAGAAPTYSEAG